MRKGKILLFCKNKNLYTNQRLKEEFNHLNISVSFLNPTEPLLHTDLAKTKLPIIIRTGGYDYNDDDLLLADSLCLSKTHVFNPIGASKIFRDKLKQYQFFKNNNIPTIDSIRSKEIENFSGKEVIIKTLRGLGGKGVYLFNSKVDAQHFLSQRKKLNDENYLIQPYILKKDEVRIYVIKGKIVAAILKIPNTNSFKGNKEHSSAKVIALDLNTTNQINEIIKKLEHLSLSYFALDLFIINNSIKVLELNILPGIEVIESLTQINIAQQMAKTIADQL